MWILKGSLNGWVTGWLKLRTRVVAWILPRGWWPGSCHAGGGLDPATRSSPRSLVSIPSLSTSVLRARSTSARTPSHAIKCLPPCHHYPRSTSARTPSHAATLSSATAVAPQLLRRALAPCAAGPFPRDLRSSAKPSHSRNAISSISAHPADLGSSRIISPISPISALRASRLRVDLGSISGRSRGMRHLCGSHHRCLPRQSIQDLDSTKNLIGPMQRRM